MAIDTLFWEMTGQDLPEGKGALLPKGDMVKGKGPKGKGHAAPPPLPWAAPPGAPRPSKGEGPKTKGKAKGGKGPAKVGGKAPEKVAGKAPEKGGGKAPDKGGGKAPAKGAGKGKVKGKGGPLPWEKPHDPAPEPAADSPPADAPGAGGPDLAEKQKISVHCRVVAVRNAPKGCRPQVEVRVRKAGDIGGDVRPVPNPVMTAARGAESIEETLVVKSATYAAGTVLQAILWSFDEYQSWPVGMASVPLKDALAGCKPLTSSRVAEERLSSKRSFRLEGDGLSDCAVELRFGYTQHCKITVEVVRGHKLPIMDWIGTIDAQVELRLVSGDSTLKNLTHFSGEETLWQAETSVMTNTQEPKWNQTFNFTTVGDPDYHLFVIVWDDDTPMPATPVGTATVPLSTIVSEPVDKKQELKLKLTQVPGEEQVKDLRLATIFLNVSWQPK